MTVRDDVVRIIVETLHREALDPPADYSVSLRNSGSTVTRLWARRRWSPRAQAGLMISSSTPSERTACVADVVDDDGGRSVRLRS